MASKILSRNKMAHGLKKKKKSNMQKKLHWQGKDEA